MKQDVRGEALAALEAAGCKGSYERAKLLVARLDGVSQLEMIDNVRSTRARLITKGVL